MIYPYTCTTILSGYRSSKEPARTICMSSTSVRTWPSPRSWKTLSLLWRYQSILIYGSISFILSNFRSQSTYFSPFFQPFIVKLEKEEDPDKKGMYVKIKAKVEKALSEVKASQDEGQSREVKEPSWLLKILYTCHRLCMIHFCRFCFF